MLQDSKLEWKALRCAIWKKQKADVLTDRHVRGSTLALRRRANCMTQPVENSRRKPGSKS